MDSCGYLKKLFFWPMSRSQRISTTGAEPRPTTGQVLQLTIPPPWSCYVWTASGLLLGKKPRKKTGELSKAEGGSCVIANTW